MQAFLVFLSVLTLFTFAHADETHNWTLPTGYVHKIVVFPMAAGKIEASATDDAWWKVREELTDTKRFVVATKRFMVQKDVFQVREELRPPDVILLSDLLEADTIIVMGYSNHTVRMIAYTGYDGSRLWRAELELHPSLPAKGQIAPIAIKLIHDFIAAVPFQGMQILDPIINKPVFEDGDVHLAKVDVGTHTAVAEGDFAQWVSLEKTGDQPLFQSGARVEVVAEGVVAKNKDGVLTVEIKRVRDLKQLTENSLVRLPKEADRLKSTQSLEVSQSLLTKVRYNPLPPAVPENSESRPLIAALAGIANAIVFFILAL